MTERAEQSRQGCPLACAIGSPSGGSSGIGRTGGSRRRPGSRRAACSPRPDVAGDIAEVRRLLAEALKQADDLDIPNVARLIAAALDEVDPPDGSALH